MWAPCCPMLLCIFTLWKKKKRRETDETVLFSQHTSFLIFSINPEFFVVGAKKERHYSFERVLFFSLPSPRGAGCCLLFYIEGERENKFIPHSSVVVVELVSHEVGKLLPGPRSLLKKKGGWKKQVAESVITGHHPPSSLLFFSHSFLLVMFDFHCFHLLESRRWGGCRLNVSKCDFFFAKVFPKSN